MSLRALIIAVFILLGVLAASVVVFESYFMRESSERAQIKTLSRVIKISSNEILRQTVDHLSEVASGAQKDRGFKKTVKKLIKTPDSVELKESVVSFLNEQFHQKMITAGIVNLQKIRIYDLKFNQIAESTEGLQNLKPGLPQSILAAAKPRKKADRLKLLNTIWSSEEGAMISLLAPVGGLLLSGYMEVIADPVNNLRDLQSMMGIPIKIIGTDNEVKFESKSWAEVESDTTLAINYDLLDENGEATLLIQALEDLESMYVDIKSTELLVAGVFIVVFGLGLTLAILTMNKFVFGPMRNMVKNLAQVAAGDMRINVSENDKITEIKSINSGLDFVANNLSQKLRDIARIGNSLKESSEDLSVQAQRSVASAKQQNEDVVLLISTTEKLVKSSEAVHENSVSTALTSSDADEKTAEGQTIIGSTEQSMSNMSAQIKHAVESINTLKNNVSNVDSILDNIQTIAEQTNLLALNAAIEAARAGENGRGFAVVADEVRQLAGRTQIATQEVVKVLNDLTAGAETAVEAMSQGESLVEESVIRVQETRSALEEIASKVTEITDMNTVIVGAANTQTFISTDNKKGIESLSNVAAQVEADAEQLTSRSQALEEMAQQLESLVNTFKIKSMS